jgi:hypothetical protein
MFSSGPLYTLHSGVLVLVHLYLSTRFPGLVFPAPGFLSLQLSFFSDLYPSFLFLFFLAFFVFMIHGERVYG